MKKKRFILISLMMAILPLSMYVYAKPVPLSVEYQDPTLSLYDEDGFVVYSTIISEGTTQVILPDTLYCPLGATFETRSEGCEL